MLDKYLHLLPTIFELRDHQLSFYESRWTALVLEHDETGMRKLSLPKEITEENLPSLKRICDVEVVEEVPLYCKVNPNKAQMDLLVAKFFKPLAFVKKSE